VLAMTLLLLWLAGKVERIWQTGGRVDGRPAVAAPAPPGRAA